MIDTESQNFSCLYGNAARFFFSQCSTFPRSKLVSEILYKFEIACFHVNSFNNIVENSLRGEVSRLPGCLQMGIQPAKNIIMLCVYQCMDAFQLFQSPWYR